MRTNKSNEMNKNGLISLKKVVINDKRVEEKDIKIITLKSDNMKLLKHRSLDNIQKKEYDYDLKRIHKAQSEGDLVNYLHTKKISQEFNEYSNEELHKFSASNSTCRSRADSGKPMGGSPCSKSRSSNLLRIDRGKHNVIRKSDKMTMENIGSDPFSGFEKILTIGACDQSIIMLQEWTHLKSEYKVIYDTKYSGIMPSLVKFKGKENIVFLQFTQTNDIFGCFIKRIGLKPFEYCLDDGNFLFVLYEKGSPKISKYDPKIGLNVGICWYENYGVLYSIGSNCNSNIFVTKQTTNSTFNNLNTLYEIPNNTFYCKYKVPITRVMMLQF